MKPFIYANRSPVYNKPFIQEEWKRVDDTICPGADGPCWVSNFGRVWSETSRKFITEFSKNKDLYCTIPVHLPAKEGRYKYTSIMLSRAVMIAFAPVPGYEKLDVNHNDGNKDHNWIWNLSWTTRSENNLFCHRNGQREQPKGVDHYKTNLTEEDVNKICTMLMERRQCKDIASEIGCTPQIVSHILNGTTYHDKYMEYKLYELTKPRNTNRLTDEQKEIAIDFIKSNISYYSNKRDMYIDALLKAGYENPDKKDRALIAYMKRLEDSIK